jgi:elongation factor P--(R)-beta-lysine ligase
MSAEPIGLPHAVRVAVWDAALAAARQTLRGSGLREVTTPVRVVAPAIEPWIEPIAASPGWLATSPELGMKRLLCRGAGPMFQLSHVFRKAERGHLHAEEFHLLEWYRLGADEHQVMRDTEAIVHAVFESTRAIVEPLTSGRAPEPPRQWSRRGFLDLVHETLGLELAGDEDDAALRLALKAVSPTLAAALDPPKHVADADIEVRTLWGWTAFFSAWSDEALDPWLGRQTTGVHVVDFPVALAALAEASCDGCTAHRFESHVSAMELCNGYRELRRADEQRRRFATVARLRSRFALVALPMPEAFLTDLVELGLPACCGAALGLDRLVVLACGASALEDVTLHLEAP